MARRGRKRQLDVEARYWELLASGVGTVAACRGVGITGKTGYRWRAEAGGVAPARLAEAVRSNRYLSLLERQRIAALREKGAGIREIATVPGAVCVHGEPGAAPQHRPPRPRRVRAGARPCPRSGPDGSAGALPAVGGPRVA